MRRKQKRRLLDSGSGGEEERWKAQMGSDLDLNHVVSRTNRRPTRRAILLLQAGVKPRSSRKANIAVPISNGTPSNLDIEYSR